MKELTITEAKLTCGGVSSSTVSAGAKILGRAFIGGVAIGSGVGMLIGVGMIAYDVYQTLKD